MHNNLFARRSGLFVSLLAGAALAACGDGAAPLVPSKVEVVAGNAQTVSVGATVPIHPAVRVLTSDGKPVPGVKVTFAAAAESGTVTGPDQVTDVSGVATVTSWTVGTKSGLNTLTATAQGLSPVSITATTSPGAAKQVQITQGDAQQGVVGSALAVAPSLRVADTYGNPVPAVTVTFTASAGAVQTATAQTDASGVATAGTWTLGTKSGAQTVTATVNATDLESVPVVFSATANPDAASTLKVVVQPSAQIVSGQRFAQQPVVEIQDRFGNLANVSATAINASLLSGTGTLSGTTSIVTNTGRATFVDLTFTGTGPMQLRFSAGALPDATSSAISVTAVATCPGTALTVNMQLGEMTRFVASESAAPRCLEFTAANAGQQYLLMLENMTARGDYLAALFPGGTSDNGAFQVSVTSGNGTTSSSAPVSSASVTSSINAEGLEGWNFGGVPAYELTPKTRDAAPAKVKRGVDWISTESESAALGVGDTISMQLEGITRLGIPTGQQRAIVRFVNADIVIAEDLRFYTDTLTFRRSSGSRNMPIPDSVLNAIATEYATYARPQADRVFGVGSYNSNTNANPGRPIAVHTMMYADNIWGYTYMSPNYFAWDYWVNSDGRVPTIYQHVQRNADDLFMHEIAHMRHYGLLEAAGRTALVGNRWLVEGWARFTERLPIAARLLNDQNFSRTNNVILPFNPVITVNGQQAYFFDDVATYGWAGQSAWGGYQYSSFIFDYFADQVAASGGNWRTALAELLTAGGNESDISGVTQRYLNIDFRTLFTRARIAAYLDDIGTLGLPAWTQYLQYQLRASRPIRDNTVNALIDPRHIWPTITVGQDFADLRTVDSGGAFGYVISPGAAAARVSVNAAKVSNGAITLVRIK